jgi:predicted TIM-barrel fold metal-dependent hydrolase
MQFGEPSNGIHDLSQHKGDVTVFVRDSFGEPFRDLECVLTTGGRSFSVCSDDQGRARWSGIPVGACRVDLPCQRSVQYVVTSEPAGAPNAVLPEPPYYLLVTGYTYILSPQWPALHIDAHMHIMSGNCTPLPPLYGVVLDNTVGQDSFGRKLFDPVFRGFLRPDRAAMNSIARSRLVRIFSRIGELSWRSTYEIGLHTAELNNGLPTVYTQQALTRSLPPAGSGRLGISIVLPMDMDYCHIDAYSGEPIYLRGEDGRWFYYHRKSGTQPAGERTKKYLDLNETQSLDDKTPEVTPSLMRTVAVYLLQWLSGASMPTDPAPLTDIPQDIARAVCVRLVTAVVSDLLMYAATAVGLPMAAFEGALLDALLAHLYEVPADTMRHELIDWSLKRLEDEWANGLPFGLSLENWGQLAVAAVDGLIELAAAGDLSWRGLGDAVWGFIRASLIRFAIQILVGQLFPIDLFETWEQQCKQTERVAVERPLQMIPMFHYEPRRYFDERPPSECTDDKCAWQQPFTRMITKGGLYVGMKMYSSQGYRPTDFKRIPHLEDFFRRCEGEQIPIMTHCTPSGFYTHQRTFFYDLEENPDRQTPAGFRQRMKYFQDRYVHPAAWGELLAKFPQLRLCLAHFASDPELWGKLVDPRKMKKKHRKELSPEELQKQSVEYDERHKEKKMAKHLLDYETVTYERNTYRNWVREIVQMCAEFDNFYTDISYLPIFKTPSRDALGPILQDNPSLINKIMFGTDWYMILSTNNRYSRWFTQAIRALEQIQRELKEPKFRPGLNLFHHWAIVNPICFYRFDVHAEDMIKNYKNHIDSTFGPRDGRRRQRAIDQLEERAASFRALSALIEPIRSKLAVKAEGPHGVKAEGPHGVPELAFTAYHAKAGRP